MRFDQLYTFMIQVRYTQFDYENCVYLRVFGDMWYIYLKLYVDDMLIANKSLVEMNKLKFRLSVEFDIKYISEAKNILGTEIRQDRKVRKLWLSKGKYVKKVLQRFSMDNVKTMLVPLIQHLNFW